MTHSPEESVVVNQSNPTAMFASAFCNNSAFRTTCKKMLVSLDFRNSLQAMNEINLVSVIEILINQNMK